MPLATTKSNQEETRPIPGVDADTQLVIRSSREFAALYQTNFADGGVFYPTRKKLPVGRVVTLKVRLGRRQPPLLVFGRIAWRRPGRHLEKIRAGVGVELLPSERPKSDYLLQLARSRSSKLSAGSALSLPFRRESFDFLIGIGHIEYPVALIPNMRYTI